MICLLVSLFLDKTAAFGFVSFDVSNVSPMLWWGNLSYRCWLIRSWIKLSGAVSYLFCFFETVYKSSIGHRTAGPLSVNVSLFAISLGLRKRWGEGVKCYLSCVCIWKLETYWQHSICEMSMTSSSWSRKHHCLTGKQRLSVVWTVAAESPGLTIRYFLP